MALDTSPEHPAPVRQITQAIGQWIDRLGAVWVEGQVAQLSRRPGQRTVFITLRDPSVVERIAALRYREERGRNRACESDPAWDYVMALGYLQAPVVVAGNDHWSGFRPDRIKALGAVAATASLGGLTPATTYHFRIVATSAGTPQ